MIYLTLPFVAVESSPFLLTGLGLFLLGGVAVLARKVLPVSPLRQTLADVIKNAPSIASYLESDRAANRSAAPQPKNLTVVDFGADDLTHCTDEELVYLVSKILGSARGLILTDPEIDLFWRVRGEMIVREYQKWESPTASASC